MSSSSQAQHIPSQNETTPSNKNNAQKQSQKSHNGSAIRIAQSHVRKQQQVIGTKPKVKRKVTELRCAEIRWFYKRKEDTKWLPFQGYDSTVLEVAYRKYKNIEIDEATKQHLAILPETNVIVMDGSYIADEQLENVHPIYWKDGAFKIRRGSWFYQDSMQPLPSEFANIIEAHHLRSFRDNVIPETPLFSKFKSNKKPELTTVKWGEEEVCWNSVVDVLIAPQKNNVVVRFLTRSKGPIPLRRAYTDEAAPEEGKPNFSDLILVVHGIGQKSYENLIAQNTAQIREAIQQQMEKYYPNEKRRPAILPIEWRSTLLLDNGLTDVVTLPKMAKWRNTLNSVAMDLMYYQSPLYRTEIINGVIKSLNYVYQTFKENNPDFSGPVSIVAHSLGSVIAYDILTNWSPFLLYDQFVSNAIAENMHCCTSDDQRQLLEQFYNSRKRLLDMGDLMEQILIRQEEPLKFHVKFLFCLGSPLAVWLIMRGADYRCVVPSSEKVQRIFNIFHPYDPVAYRLEPVFHENYKHIRPLKLFNHQDAIKSYESVIFECHQHYLKKCKSGKKREEKEAAATKNGKKREKDENVTENEKSGNAKSDKTRQKDSSQTTKLVVEEGEADDDDEHQFIGDTDSDLDIASSGGAYSPTNGSTPRSLTPQQQNQNSTAQTRSETSPTMRGNPSITEQAIEVEEEENDDEEALPADDEKQTIGSSMINPLDDLKSMGEAGRLIEQIPRERRINQRIDFQVKPWMLDKSFWSMMKSHFSYWTNLDVAAFLLNTIYPPPLETPVIVKS